MKIIQTMLSRGIPFAEIDFDAEEKPEDYGWWSLEFNIDHLTHYCIPLDCIDKWHNLPPLATGAPQ